MVVAMTTDDQMPIPDTPAVPDAWFFVRDRTAVGPIPLAELVRVLKARPDGGKTDLVWRAGFVNWLKAGEVLELASHVPFSPPPTPYGAGEGML